MLCLLTRLWCGCGCLLVHVLTPLPLLYSGLCLCVRRHVRHRHTSWSIRRCVTCASALPVQSPAMHPPHTAVLYTTPGSSPPADQSATGQNMLVKLTSDSSVQQEGFQATFDCRTPPPPSAFSCATSSGTTTFPEFGTLDGAYTVRESASSMIGFAFLPCVHLFVPWLKNCELKNDVRGFAEQCRLQLDSDLHHRLTDPDIQQLRHRIEFRLRVHLRRRRQQRSTDRGNAAGFDSAVGRDGQRLGSSSSLDCRWQPCSSRVCSFVHLPSSAVGSSAVGRRRVRDGSGSGAERNSARGRGCRLLHERRLQQRPVLRNRVFHRRRLRWEHRRPVLYAVRRVS